MIKMRVLRDFYISSSAGWQVRGRAGEVIEVNENVSKMLNRAKMAQYMPQRSKSLREAPEAVQGNRDNGEVK